MKRNVKCQGGNSWVFTEAENINAELENIQNGCIFLITSLVDIMIATTVIAMTKTDHFLKATVHKKETPEVEG